MALPTILLLLLLVLLLPLHSLILLQEFFSSRSFTRIYKTQLTSFFPF
jgi:hypothetical protein